MKIPCPGVLAVLYVLLSFLHHQLGTGRQPGAVAAHGTAPLEGGAVLDHQRGRVELGEYFTAGGNLDPARGMNRAAHRAGDEKLSHLELALDLPGFADDQVALRLHRAGELTVDAERSLEAQLALQVAAAVQETVQIALLA